MTSPSRTEAERLVALHRSGATRSQIVARMGLWDSLVQEWCDQLRLYPLHGLVAWAAWSGAAAACYRLGVPSDQVRACLHPGLAVDDEWVPSPAQRDALGRASDIAEGIAWYEQQQQEES